MAKLNKSTRKQLKKCSVKSDQQDNEGIILYQINYRITNGKRNAFIQHLVDNYYAPYFKDSSRDDIQHFVEELIPVDNNYDDDEPRKVKIPLIASKNFIPGGETYKTKKNGEVFYLPIPSIEIRTGQKPELEPDTVDKVFSCADGIITELKKGISSFIQSPQSPLDGIVEKTVPEFEDKTETETKAEDDVNGVNEAVKVTPPPHEQKGAESEDNALLALCDKLDSARKNEKETYNQIRERFIQGLKSISVPNPELKRCRAQINDLNSRLESANKQYNECKRKLDNAEADKRRAVEEANSQNKKRYDDLKAAHDKYQKDADDYKSKWQTEERKRKEHEKTIDNRDTTIKRLNEESRLYNERVVFFRSTQGFAKLAMDFFDSYDELLEAMAKQKAKEPGMSSDEVDNYNYYIIRIERKFHKALTSLKGVDSWRRELQMLAQTGLVPTGGIIDSKLGNNKVKEAEWDSTLSMLFYHEVMTSLAGAAVVMCDEMAFMLPHQVPDVKGTDGFAKISERLQKAISAMGYELNYVKPFTKLSQYKDVENVKFTEADVPSGTIFEVIKMALNYGSTKSKTEVSSKE